MSTTGTITALSLTVFSIKTHEESDEPVKDCGYGRNDLITEYLAGANATTNSTVSYYPECTVVDVEGRLAIVSMLLLTIVTFKMGYAETLPKLSYLTVLDKYFTLNLTFLIVLTFVICSMKYVQYYVSDFGDARAAAMTPECDPRARSPGARSSSTTTSITSRHSKGSS